MSATGITDSYDIVVVGHGVSGLSAAIAAHEEGANPIVLEKSPYEKRGGHTRHAGGLFRFPMADPEQAKEDLELEHAPEQYTQQDFYDDLMDVSDGRADDDLCTELVENAYDAIRWITDHGVGWHIVDHSDEPGFGTTVGAVQADREGLGVVEDLTDRIEELGIDVHYDTEFRGIETDENNEVSAAKAGGRVGRSPTRRTAS